MHKSVARAFADGTRIEQVMMLMQMLGRDDVVGDVARNKVDRLVGVGPAHHGTTLSGISTLGDKIDPNNKLAGFLEKFLGGAAKKIPPPHLATKNCSSNLLQIFEPARVSSIFEPPPM